MIQITTIEIIRVIRLLEEGMLAVDPSDLSDRRVLRAPEVPTVAAEDVVSEDAAPRVTRAHQVINQQKI